MRFRVFQGVIVTLLLLVQFASFAEVPARRPNFLLVMVDDMGWTDIGAFGSEIETRTSIPLPTMA